jgi:hypothetical protein
MHQRFAKLVDTLAPKLKESLAMKPVRNGTILMSLPMRGVYLFSKGRRHLYVGRSNTIRKRFHRHFTHPRGAAFAFLLARKATGRTKRNYSKGSGATPAAAGRAANCPHRIVETHRLMEVTRSDRDFGAAF